MHVALRAAPLALALSLASSRAFADEARPEAVQAPSNVVVLRDGSLLYGHVTERVLGDHLTITLESGQKRRLAWSELRIAEPSAPVASTTTWSPVEPVAVAGYLGLASSAAGGGLLLGQLFVHDDATRHPMQITGAVLLGAGLTVIFVAGGIALGRSIGAR